MKKLILSVVCVMAWLSAAPAQTAEFEKTPQQIENLAEELVLKLGDPSFRKREAASQELVKLGLGSLKAIDEGRRNPDPEIMTRCELLYPKIRTLDFKRRISKYLEGKDAKFEHDLPGLKLFREKLGADDKSLALFIEILKSLDNVEMFAELEKGNTEGGRAIAVRRKLMWLDSQRFLPWNAPTRRPPPLADIAALQFAEWLVPSDSIPKTGEWDSIIGQLMGEQPAAATIESPDKPHHEVYRTIATSWLASRTDRTQLTNIVKALNNPPFGSLKESRTLLRRIVLTEGLEPVVPYQALGMLVQADYKSEPKLLRAVQKGEVRVGDFPDVYPNEKDPNRKIAIRNDIPIFAGDNQLRDAALAYLVHQEKLNIRDFGFETPEGFNLSLDKPLYFNQFSFKTEEKRSFGHAKWFMKQLIESLPSAKPDTSKKNEPKKPSP